MARKEKTSKRKARENDIAVTNGANFNVVDEKGLGDKDGAEIVDDLNEPTMGEKLATLNLVEKDETMNYVTSEISPPTNPPSADSVYVLLKQALRADDRALLVDCLSRREDKVITNSLSMLNPSDVLKLLQSLVSIIQLSGAVVIYALPWLRSLLLQHTGSIMSQESCLVALNSLYQLIESRVSTMGHAFQLSSCLNLLYAETLDDGEEKYEAATPVVFEDDDGSEDEDSQNSMEIESIEDDQEPGVYSDISDN